MTSSLGRVVLVELLDSFGRVILVVLFSMECREEDDMLCLLFVILLEQICLLSKRPLGPTKRS